MKYLIGPVIGLVIVSTVLLGGWIAMAFVTWSIPVIQPGVIRIVLLIGVGLGLFIVADESL